MQVQDLLDYMYRPPDKDADKIRKEQEDLAKAKAQDESWEQDMSDVLDASGLGIVVQLIFCLWALLTLLSILRIFLKICRRAKQSQSKKDQLATSIMVGLENDEQIKRYNMYFMLFGAIVLTVCSFLVFRIDMVVELLLSFLYISNMAFIWSILYTLGLTSKNPDKLIDSFGRIRTVLLFSWFIQSIVFVFGFSEGKMGG